MLSALIECLPKVFSTSVWEKGCINWNGSDEVSLYARDIATISGMLGNGEPLQVLSRKLLKCMGINDDPQ
jgi:hypothetical protein